MAAERQLRFHRLLRGAPRQRLAEPLGQSFRKIIGGR
jgi:hypothetical protein